MHSAGWASSVPTDVPLRPLILDLRRTPSNATHENCFVEMRRVAAVFTPKDATRLNGFVASRLSQWTRLRLETTSFHQFFRFWTFQFLTSWVASDRKHVHTKRPRPDYSRVQSRVVATSRDTVLPIACKFALLIGSKIKKRNIIRLGMLIYIELIHYICQFAIYNDTTY